MRVVVPAVFAVLLLASGCTVDYHAAPAAYDLAPLTESERAEFDELSAQLDRTRQQLADTRAELTSMGQRLNAVEGSVEEIRSAGGGSASLPELGQRLAALESEARSQREMLQVRGEELRLLRDAVLNRPRVPAGTAAAAPGVPAPTGVPAPPAVPAPVAEGARPGALVRQDGDAAAVQQDYENAWKRLRERDYRGAIQQFKKFVEKHPGSSLTDNAQYWVGESHYALGEFDQAILEFDAVLKKYPDGDKTPAAWLKIGYAFVELGNRVDARLFLQEVIDKYPGSKEAGRAQERLQKIQAPDN